MGSGSCLYVCVLCLPCSQVSFLPLFVFLSSGVLRKVSCCIEMMLRGSRELAVNVPPSLVKCVVGVFEFQIPRPTKNQHTGYGFYQTRCSFFSACRATSGGTPSVTIQLRSSSIHIDKCHPQSGLICHQDKGLQHQMSFGCGFVIAHT